MFSRTIFIKIQGSSKWINIFNYWRLYISARKKFLSQRLKPRTSFFEHESTSVQQTLQCDGKFQASTNFSINYKIADQLKVQSCFVTGWSRCRRSKFPSHWLSDRLSYESAIVLKLEVLDLGLLLLMCFFCVVCAFQAPSQAQSYFYIFQVL